MGYEAVFAVKRSCVTTWILKPCHTGIHLLSWPPLVVSPASGCGLVTFWKSDFYIEVQKCCSLVCLGFFVWLGFFWLGFFPPHLISAVYSGKNDFFFLFPLFPFLLRKKRWEGKKNQSHYVFLHYHYHPCKTMPLADPSVLEGFWRNIKARFLYFEFLRKINWLLSQFIFLPLLCCTWSKTYSQAQMLFD